MRIVYGIIVFVVALAVVATIIGRRTQIERADDILYLALAGEPQTLHPLIANGAPEGQILYNMQERLVEGDMWTLELKPGLATDWEVSDDKLLYTFHLRENVRWHDGTPFTADDVLYTYNRIVNDPEALTENKRKAWEDCEACEVLDDHTVRFRWREANYFTFSVCAHMWPMPRNAFDNATGKAFNHHPVMSRLPVLTGPYRIVEWTTGVRVVLERNDDYWGEKPYFRRIVFLIVTDSQARFQLFKKGIIDMTDLSPTRWLYQTNSEEFKRQFIKVHYPTFTIYFLVWNNDRVWFKDKRVRRAMTHLVNRQKILDTVQHGFGEVITGPPYPSHPAYNRAIKPIPYDPEAAKRLLDEAGWSDHDGDGLRDKDGVKFDFEITVTQGWREQLATIFQEDLRKVGIRMRIRRLDWAVFLSNADERNYDAMAIGSIGGSKVNYYGSFHSTEADKEKSYNRANFRNAEVDEIIEKAWASFDDEERLRLHHRFNEIIHEEQPYTFLYASEDRKAYNRRLVNVRFTPAFPNCAPRLWRAVPRDQIDHSLPAERFDRPQFKR